MKKENVEILEDIFELSIWYTSFIVAYKGVSRFIGPVTKDSNVILRLVGKLMCFSMAGTINREVFNNLRIFEKAIKQCYLKAKK